MKHYLDQNVYDSANERIAYLFEEFEKVMVAFSGGKDSGVMLNLCYEYAKKNNLMHKLAFYHLDYEAQYQMTTDYVTETFERLNDVESYWLCLPLRAQCAVNSIEAGWIPWDREKKEIWVRDMPDHPSVINAKNCLFPFEKGEWDYDVQDHFCDWYAAKQKTAICIGIRTTESLNRYRAIKGSHKVNVYDDKSWIVDDTYCKAYPVYDWETRDIWIANGKFKWPYNRVYDLYYQAGLTIDQMRVASPFHDSGIGTLKLYKVIDPDNWARMVGRVKGVNFAGIYGGTTAMGWKSIKLPEGHTWKSYLEFLIATLPSEARQNYMDKFETSVTFWREKGGVLSDETIQELKEIGLNPRVGKQTNYKTTKKPVTFDDYPDDADVKDFKLVPSYKRMAICIMKNDHLCKYMGFGQTKADTERRAKAIEKYSELL